MSVCLSIINSKTTGQLSIKVIPIDYLKLEEGGGRLKLKLIFVQPLQVAIGCGCRTCLTHKFIFGLRKLNIFCPFKWFSFKTVVFTPLLPISLSLSYSTSTGFEVHSKQYKCKHFNKTSQRDNFQQTINCAMSLYKSDSKQI